MRRAPGQLLGAPLRAVLDCPAAALDQAVASALGSDHAPDVLRELRQQAGGEPPAPFLLDKVAAARPWTRAPRSCGCASCADRAACPLCPPG